MQRGGDTAETAAVLTRETLREPAGPEIIDLDRKGPEASKGVLKWRSISLSGVDIPLKTRKAGVGIF